MPNEPDRLKGAHLLRRFGLGASETELDYYLANGLVSAVDKLLNYDAVDEGFSFELSVLKNPKNGRVPMVAATAWWGARLVMTRRPLQEKMTIFWHNHFATSASKVNQTELMVQQNATLRKNATGNFRTMLKDLSKDPAMLFWLDNRDNVRGHANENFAREVMELFTLGVGNYSETDVKEAARAFTGWSFRREPLTTGVTGEPESEFFERIRQHDDGEKTVLGHTGALDGDDVLDVLCAQRQTALRLTHKLWEWFVYPDPHPDVVAHFANVLLNNDLEIKPWLRTIMLDPEFYSTRAMRTVVKSPVDVCIATLRQLGVGTYLAPGLADLAAGGAPRGALGPVYAAIQSMRNMGMWLMYPPDVAGWNFGRSWISSATMVERMSWGGKLFQGRYPTYALLQQDPRPEAVVAKLISIFDAPIPSAKVEILVKAAREQCGDGITETTANKTAQEVCRLMFVTPEFQMM